MVSNTKTWWWDGERGLGHLKFPIEHETAQSSEEMKRPEKEMWGLVESLSAAPCSRQGQHSAVVSVYLWGYVATRSTRGALLCCPLIRKGVSIQMWQRRLSHLPTHWAALGHFHFCSEIIRLQLFPIHLDLSFFQSVLQRGLGSSVMSFSTLVIRQCEVILPIGGSTHGCHGSED